MQTHYLKPFVFLPLFFSRFSFLFCRFLSQDDLALLFVDMRSTLLVTTAAAGAVMDELCLRTETFEQVSMVYCSPGELVVCAPQVTRVLPAKRTGLFTVLGLDVQRRCSNFVHG